MVVVCAPAGSRVFQTSPPAETSVDTHVLVCPGTDKDQTFESDGGTAKIGGAGLYVFTQPGAEQTRNSRVKKSPGFVVKCQRQPGRL